MTAVLRSLRARVPGDVVSRGVGGVFVLKIAALALTFVGSVVLGKGLGVEGFGAYNYALAWVSLLSIPAGLGLDRLLVRQVAAYRSRESWGLLRGLLERTNTIGLSLSLLLAVVAALVTRLVSGPTPTEVSTTLYVAILALPLMTLNMLRQSALRGLGRVTVGQVPDMILHPVLFLVLLGGLSWYGRLSGAGAAMGAYVASYGVAFAVGAVILARVLPMQVARARGRYDTRRWLQASVYFMFITGMQVINVRTDTLMLGLLGDTAAVGVYSVAARGSELVTFGLGAINAALAPAVASLYALGHIDGLQRLVTRYARLGLLVAVPVALAMVLFGRSFLGIYGPGFQEGYAALVILCGGRVINAFAGSVSLVLVMTGHERRALLGIGVSVVANIVLNAVLIPRMGPAGAATATAVSMVVWNLLLVGMVHRALGVHATAFGRLGRGASTPAEPGHEA